MCGVFGVVLPTGEPTEAASIAALGLFALQHRGQESAGLAVSDGEQLMLYKDLGMISSALGGGRPRRPAPPPRRASAAGWRSPAAATRRPARRSGRTPSRPIGWAPAGRSP